jgi:hypothetical protein
MRGGPNFLSTVDESYRAVYVYKFSVWVTVGDCMKLVTIVSS